MVTEKALIFRKTTKLTSQSEAMKDYTKLIKALIETDFSNGCPCEAEEMCKGEDCVIIQAATALEELTKNDVYESENLGFQLPSAALSESGNNEINRGKQWYL